MKAPAAIPHPARVMTALTSVFWQAADEGQLLLQRCQECGHHQFYPRAICRHCWSENVTWEQASGDGRIWTYTVAHQPGHPAWNDEAPYVIAIVELDEGPRMLSRVIDCDRRDVTVGARVRLAAGATPPLAFTLS